MTGKYEGYFENIIYRKYETLRKKREKEIAERLRKVNKRLNQPLLKKPLIKKSKGKANVRRGIKTLWDTI